MLQLVYHVYKYVWLGYVSKGTFPDYGRTISWNVAWLDIFLYDVMKLLYYGHWTDKRKYFYVTYLYLKTLKSITRTSESILVKLMNLVNGYQTLSFY